MSPRAPVRSAILNGTARSPISTVRVRGFLCVSVQSSAPSFSVNDSTTARSCGGAIPGSVPTRHSAMLTVDSGAIREYDANGRPHYPLEAEAMALKELV